MRGLELRAHEVARILLEGREAVRHPVELDGAPRPFEGQMAMPGAVRALEDEKRAFDRGNLLGVILDVGAVAKETQVASFLVPGVVEVDEDGDDLAFKSVCIPPSRARVKPRMVAINGLPASSTSNFSAMMSRKRSP